MDEIKFEDSMQILIVDDEEMILRSIKRLLIDEDLDILTANSGKEALKILGDNQDVGLIISDQRMPGLSGVDFLEQAKKLAPDATRMVLTGYADIKAATDAINRGGAYRYITKPWKDDELIQVIRDAIHKHILIKENKRLTEVVKKQNEEIKEWNSQLEYYVQEQTIEIQNKNKELQTINVGLKNNFKNTIIAFSSLIELRDKRSRNHSRNVAEISTKAARRLDLSDKELESITVAALLHDIGKIGLPDILLLKDPEEMDSEEFKKYALHPVRGQAVVNTIEDMRQAGLIIRHHHEWHNGYGFPDKLWGNKIPVGSRIIAIADFVDNAISRSEGKNTIEYALDKAKMELGKRFDLNLYPLIEEPVREIYKGNTPQPNMRELELGIKDLKPGMIVSRDVRTGTGILLLSKRMKLHENNIQTLKHSYLSDPSKNGVFVWVKN